MEMRGTLRDESGVGEKRFPEGSYWPVRRLLLLCLLAAVLASGHWLGLSWEGLKPSGAGWTLVNAFFGKAFQPAWDYESTFGLPAERVPFLGTIGQAAVETLRYALAAVSLSLAGGLVLGFLGSSVWWPEGRPWWARGVWGVARFIMTFLRSVHELIWATLFLAAVGITPLTAVLAIALPYAGTLAKVFAEMSEECPPDVKDAYRALGARPVPFFLCGVVPRIWAELASYSLYRFECGLRSAAVMGFLGLPTLGLKLSQSYENLHYREVWTCLYALLFLVVVFDFASGWVRKRLVGGVEGRRDVPLTVVLLLLGLGIAWAWWSPVFWQEPLGGVRAGANVKRFLGELIPYPLREIGWDFGVFWAWLSDLLFSPKIQAGRAILNTFAMSVVAICLAGAFAWIFAAFGARTLMALRPFLPAGTGVPSRWWSVVIHLAWRGVCLAVRSCFVFARAIPEYVWAFLLVASVPDQWWVAILALALHNFGILGRLVSETVENADAAVPRGLRGLGASRSGIFSCGLGPIVLPRFLVYFFYRWETCIREGTVLGMLGVATLGRILKEARVADRMDELIVYVVLGAGLVFLGDLISALVRKYVRI